MPKISIYTRSLIIAVSAIISFANAGPNVNALVYLDNDFTTAGIEPDGKFVSLGDTIFIAAHIKEAVNLNSYSVKLQFDSSIVQYCNAAVKTSFVEKPFLELSGGQIIVLPHQQGNEAELAATLKGIGFSVSGNGCLGYSTFRCIRSGNPAIMIKNAKLVDGKSTIDKVQ
jgi:hypothetical protein